MLRRIRVYLVGVFLGCIIVFYFFGDRDFSYWHPGNRIITKLNSEKVSWSNKAVCQFECYHLDQSSFHYDLNSANVNISKSLTREEPKKYMVEFTNYHAWVIMYKDSSVISEIELTKKPEKDCPC